MESLYDIIHDLQSVHDSAVWVSENYFDTNIIPIPHIEDRPIELRGLYLDALLMKYRRCFVTGHRHSLKSACPDEILGEYAPLHRETLKRANHITAHAISAAASTQLYISGGKASPGTARPGYNQFDFTNLVALAERWTGHVGEKISGLTQEFESLLKPEDEQPPDFFVAPWGSGVDIQAVRTGVPQEKTAKDLAQRKKT